MFDETSDLDYLDYNPDRPQLGPTHIQPRRR